MTCSACTNAVTDSLKELPGVSEAQVSLITEDATVIHDDTVTPSQLTEAIDDIGFEPGVPDTDEIREKVTEYETHLTIGGMTCSACVTAVTDALKSEPGVSSAEVSLITEEATVVHNTQTTPESLSEAVEDIGFEATIKSSDQVRSGDAQDLPDEKVELKVLGMTCSNCSNTVTELVSALPGVKSCDVALVTEEARIVFDSNLVGIRDIIQTIEDAGFEASVATAMDTQSQLKLLAKERDIQYWKSNFFKLLLFGIPILFLQDLFPAVRRKCHMNPETLRISHGVYLDMLVQFALATYVQFWLGRRFYTSAIKALQHLSGTMDSLICTSTTIVYFYSLFSIIRSMCLPSDEAPVMLFDTSTMLFTFVTLGKWAESKAKGNTSTALSKLLELAPSSCIIVENPEAIENALSEKRPFDSADIVQKTIGTELLQKGDIAIVLPGASVPTDGMCIFGRSSVDESLLTGESMPVTKVVGSQLVGGSVNTSSTLYMRVEKVGEKTQLQQIVRLVRDAQVTKAPVQRFADAIAAKFVPSILTLALFTFVFWNVYVYFHPLDRIPHLFLTPTGNISMSSIMKVAISVVVVACPCALGLAAPTAVMVGTGAGASHGILIKGGEVLENASDIDSIIFDKTGTLTTGKMRLGRHRFVGPYAEKEPYLWSILRATEQNSEHPVAQAIIKGSDAFLKEHPGSPISLSDVLVQPGLGIEATESGKRIKIGTLQYIRSGSIENEQELEEAIESIGDSVIGSVSHVVIDNKYCGFLESRDSLRPDSVPTVRALLDNGFSVAMVTGDNCKTSKYIAKQVGIPLTNVLAEARPEDKLRYIEGLQRIGRKCSFVGDGVNDAPALVQSNLGIAIATGTDVAISAADIVLLSSENGNTGELNSTATASVEGVFHALEISRKTFRVIRMNFLLAIIYNVTMLPIAMGLLIVPFGITFHPMFASAAMACSSVSVVMNSLRLKNWKPSSTAQYAGTTGFVDLEDLSTPVDLSNTSPEEFSSNALGMPGRTFIGRARATIRRLTRKHQNRYESLPSQY